MNGIIILNDTATWLRSKPTFHYDTTDNTNQTQIDELFQKFLDADISYDLDGEKVCLFYPKDIDSFYKFCYDNKGI